MRLLWLALLLAATPIPLAARDYKGEVVAVTDGDTLTMKAGNNRRMKIRLGEIDAPENKQPYGAESKLLLHSLLYGQDIIVQQAIKDKYKRTVGIVVRADDGFNVNKEMARQGSAWAYQAYLHDQTIIALEQAARRRRIGLWSLPEDQHIPPWEWRKQRRL